MTIVTKLDDFCVFLTHFPRLRWELFHSELSYFDISEHSESVSGTECPLTIIAFILHIIILTIIIIVIVVKTLFNNPFCFFAFVFVVVVCLFVCLLSAVI